MADRELAYWTQREKDDPSGVPWITDSVLPIVDLAYQGLGLGLEEDAYGARKVIASVPEALVAYSCDKNFGLYRDRVGALYVCALPER